MERKRKLLMLTIDPVPKPGKGGPGAVVERLFNKYLQIRRNKDMGWDFRVISLSNMAHHQHGRISMRGMSILIKKFRIFRYLYEKAESAPLIGHVIIFLRQMRVLSRSFKSINNYKRILEHHRKSIEEADVIHCHDVVTAFAFLCSDIDHRSRFSKRLILTINSPGSAC